MKQVTINNNKKITLKTYLRAWRILRSIPAEKRPLIECKEGLTTWYPVTAAEVLRQYQDALMDRINGRANGLYLIKDFVERRAQ
jgi:hypothetical protein